MLTVSTRIDHRWCPLAVAAAAMLIPLRVARAEDPAVESPAAAAASDAVASGAIASV